VEVAI